MEKEEIQKEIIDYIREKEMIACLFTQESVLVTVYNHAVKNNVSGEHLKWLESKIDKIEREKIKYTNIKLDNPCTPTIICLQDLIATS